MESMVEYKVKKSRKAYGSQKKEVKMEQSIELDCPPGSPRPGDLIDGVIEGLLPQREMVGRFFGNWRWEYDDIPEEKWKEIKPIIKERVTELYNKGTIRYGSW